MNPKTDSFSGTMFLALLGGATLGAIAMALTTPKTGKEVLGMLKSLTNRLNARGRELDQYDDEDPIAMFI
jgi:gas vesicle protein